MSTGNNAITIDLSSNSTTLIVGENGCGKSQMLDALSFALFGKAHRNINKPQLLNSINEKNCLVQVEFSIHSDEYIVKRGMKPNIFEIWKNDEMLNEESQSRDYQKILEQNILKLNHKSFHQIVVLGSSNFIPFMQLPKWHRREVIEDLLDISVFTKMNHIIKERKKTQRSQIDALEHDIDSLTHRITLQKSHIKKLKDISSKSAQQLKNEIAELNAEKIELRKKIDEVQLKINDSKFDVQDEYDRLTQYMQKLSTISGKLSAEASALQKRIDFYTKHDACPTCKQKITDDLKHEMTSDSHKKLDDVNGNDVKLQAEFKKTSDSIYKANQLLAERRELSSKLTTLLTAVESVSNQIARKSELNSTDHEDDIAEASIALVKLQDECSLTQEEKIALNEEAIYYNMIEDLLKDTGIKAKIVRQYLPIINKYINEYLQIFDFFVSFNLDENFVESIRSRHRDEFSYASFSEGEKARIDLALLFTWRQIAKLKNSTNTNLLILDEIADGSLDETGLTALKGIFYNMPDTNIIVISHRETVKEEFQFDRVLIAKKENEFSILSTVW